MKKHDFKDHELGYQIIRNGHTMLPEDVCRLLDRLDFLEEVRLEEEEL